MAPTEEPLPQHILLPSSGILVLLTLQIYSAYGVHRISPRVVKCTDVQLAQLYVELPVGHWVSYLTPPGLSFHL